MKTKAFIFSGLAFMALASVSMKAEDPKFLRSSIYSVLVNSDEQNQRLDKEAKDTDPEGYAASLNGAIKSLGEIPKLTFPGIAIPEQFNDHNLEIRIIDFDKLAAGISEDEAKAARPSGGGASKFLKSAAASAVSANGESSMIRVEKVDDYMHAVVNKFLEDNQVAPYMVAKWYNYDENKTPHFDAAVIQERGLENASGTDLAKAAANEELKAMLSAQGFELLNNTFVVATNLRFRNNKALAKEISELAGAAVAGASGAAGGGALGGLAAMGAKKAAEAAANALMKDMYSVTAVTNLYKLDWNDDIDMALSDAVLYNENATLKDLLDSGKCKLTYVGQTKARAGVKKDKEKTIDQLASSATSRAIDKSLAKLQVEYDEFRTTVPVSKSADGFVYAKIGTKEGVTPGDEYDILE
ncbi:MAG: hypothetical protein K2K08_04875, partial [Paramuribaculum sp.]|nr:hypothetical protein [Paramuribaculum sp.]